MTLKRSRRRFATWCRAPSRPGSPWRCSTRTGPSLACTAAWHVASGTVSPITASTLYDLASLTKVVCSVSLAAVFAGRGSLSLGDPVARWVPQFPHSDTTLLHLMTHTSGLTDERFFERLVGQRAIAQAIVERAARSTPSGEVLYADTNFMLLGWVLEACGQASSTSSSRGRWLLH